MKRTHPSPLILARPVSRRNVLAGGAALIAAPAVLRLTKAFAQERVIKLGLVTPRTGPLAAFGDGDALAVAVMSKRFEKGIENNGRTYGLQIVTRDSQSSASRASEVAAELILNEKVNLITAAGAPDTVNPTSDQAEINEVPSVTSGSPWQVWFFGRRGDPKTGFKWTYHFCFGIDDVIAAYLDLWSGAPTNKVVGVLAANDPDGNAWADPKTGLPPAFEKAGYKVIDGGRFQPMTDDFTAQIAAFKSAGVEIVTGTMITPDFVNFWSQAAQQGFKPKIVTVGKAYLFPSAIAAIGARGAGLSCEIPYSPTYPFKSTLTGMTGPDLAAEYQRVLGKPIDAACGQQFAAMEVSIDVLRRAKSLEDPQSILEAITTTDYQSIMGRVHWGDAPLKNIARTPLVAGQWQQANGKWDLAVKAHGNYPAIPTTGKLTLLS